MISDSAIGNQYAARVLQPLLCILGHPMIVRRI